MDSWTKTQFISLLYIYISVYTEKYARRDINGASQVALVVQNLSANAGEVRGMGSICRSGRFLKGGHGNLLQILTWRIPMDRGAWWATVHGITQSWTRLKQPSKHRDIIQHDFHSSFDHSMWQKIKLKVKHF